MSPRANPSFPPAPFTLLLVEGGDEERLCAKLLPPNPARTVCFWKANGREFETHAQLIANAPNFSHCTHVGLILDAEEDPVTALSLAHVSLRALGLQVTPSHGQIIPGSVTAGVFILPDGVSRGSNEKLLRAAAANAGLVTCADAFETCAIAAQATQANRDKSWIQAYLAHSRDGGLRVHAALDQPAWFDLSSAVFDPLRSFLQALVV